MKLSILLAVFVLSLSAKAQEINWETLDVGLEYAEFKSPKKSIMGDEIINILKINPKHYQLEMVSAKETSTGGRKAPEWAKEKGFVAVFNAGMYNLNDYATNMGYMKYKGYTNNPHLNKDNTILAFDRENESVPEVQIIDRKCQDWESLKTQYGSFTQSIRMVDCNQTNRWAQQNRIWSMVITAIDKDGNILFIFTRSPYSVHNFIDILLTAPLNIYNAMYLEGGPESSFYINHAKRKVSRMGSYETDFWYNDNNNEFWEIPNVIGVKKKS